VHLPPVPAVRAASALLAGTLALAVSSVPLGAESARGKGAIGDEDVSPAAGEELARRLFHDTRFASRRGDFDTACASCHLVSEDPQGLRAHTDFLSRPWFPWRSADPRREHPRNTPTLLDVGEMPVLHLDGEFLSIEDLVRGTLTGRPLGWLPGEEQSAAEQLAAVVRSDADYARLFLQVHGVDVAEGDAVELLELAVDSLSGYLRRLRSPRHSSYDRFVALNGLPAGPTPGEPAAAFGQRVLHLLDDLERRGEITFPADTEGAAFDGEALAGLRTFLRADGTSGSGNCVSCHPPPAFSDHAFHNVGVSQEEYDSIHGPGAFARLELPAAAARPVERLRRAPSAAHPDEVDLGHWNFAPAAALEGSLAAFKTPTLRNLAYTNPYLHNGRVSTLEETLWAKVRWAEMARRGELRAADPELPAMRLEVHHLRSLVAFLATLGEELVAGRGVPALPRAASEGGQRDEYLRF